MIALDGFYIVGKSGKTKLHHVKAPHQKRLPTLLHRVIKGVVHRLEKEVLLIPAPKQASLDLDFHEPMGTVSPASTEASNPRYRIAPAPHSGSRTLTLHNPSFIRTANPTKTLTPDRNGFSLNAAVSCQPYSETV